MSKSRSRVSLFPFAARRFHGTSVKRAEPNYAAYRADVGSIRVR